jgi:hypothetical protein
MVRPRTVIGLADDTDSLAFAATDRKGSYGGVCIIDNLQAVKISTHAVDRAVGPALSQQIMR